MIDKMGKTFARSMAVFAMALLFAATLGAQTPATTEAQTPSVQSPEWKTYSYAADGFSASFPSSPTVSKKDVPTDAGSFEFRSYVVEVAPVAMSIGVCDFGAAVASKDPDTVLEGAKDGALANSNSHLVSENKIILGANHGVAFEAESDTAHLSFRTYLVGTTLYQALVVFPLGRPYADTARFLDSFQLIPRVSGRATP
ncbi:MAG: hypothetical protein ABSE51_05660 [Terracidiphilus sp.]|jgi:hypothetical protein